MPECGSSNRSWSGEIPPGAVRVEETLFPSLVARRRPVLGFCFSGHWADLGTWRRYLAMNCALLPGGQNAVAASAELDSEATVSGSSIGAKCRLAPRSSVVDSILWEGVRVGAGAAIRDSVLADGVAVGAEATIEGAVIGAGAVIEDGAVVPPGTSVEPGGRYHAKHDH